VGDRASDTTPYWRTHLATVLQLPAAQLDKAASVARTRRGDGSDSAESPSPEDRLAMHFSIRAVSTWRVSVT
jgi:hypothetical protein